MLLPVQSGPGELGWTLSVDEHFPGLLAQEQVLLAVRAHEEDTLAGVNPQPAEAAQRGLEHHGSCAGRGGVNLLREPSACTPLCPSGTRAQAGWCAWCL